MKDNNGTRKSKENKNVMKENQRNREKKRDQNNNRD